MVGDSRNGDLQRWRSTICTVHSLLPYICPFPSFPFLILLGFGRRSFGFSMYFPPTRSEPLSPRQWRASWRCSVTSGPACLLGSGAYPPALCAGCSGYSFCGGMLALRRQDSANHDSTITTRQIQRNNTEMGGCTLGSVCMGNECCSIFC